MDKRVDSKDKVLLEERPMKELVDQLINDFPGIERTSTITTRDLTAQLTSIDIGIGSQIESLRDIPELSQGTATRTSVSLKLGGFP